MSKYIIRNCNVIYFNLDKTAICNDLNLECPCECKERTDCVLKQIVELCKHYKKYSDCGRDCSTFGRFLDKLLDKLNIQEVE